MRSSNGQRSDAQQYAEKRREAALKQQNNARSKQLNAARAEAALSPLLDHPQQDQSIHDKELMVRDSRDVWQFQLPEWMVDCPANLSDDWLVLPRPEGKRCLLETSSRGQAVVRGRTGFVTHSLKSSLPASCCIDCIYHEQNRTFYALDLISWNGHEFLCCDASFRLSWLLSKIDEEAASSCPSQPSSQDHPMAITEHPMTALTLTDPATSAEFYLIPLPFFPSDNKGLSSCYHQSTLTQQPAADPSEAHFCSFGFIPDGLSFIHKESHYYSGQSPLFVLWKDGHCSRYLIDTDHQGRPLEQQQLTLQLLMDGTVATSDEPPVVLGQLPASFLEKIATGIKAGRLLRFSLGQGGITFHESRPCGADLTYLGLVSQRRSKADCFTKILFQHQARRNPTSFQHLMNCCDGGGEDKAEDDHECTMEEA